MHHFSAAVTDTVQLSEDYTQLDFETPWDEEPRPGQFVMISGPEENIIKRPFSIAGFSSNTCSVIIKSIGSVTSYLSTRKQGDHIRVLGPLGSSFPDSPETISVIYAGGGCGLPPLFFDACSRENCVNDLLFAGFSSAGDAVLIQEFKSLGMDVLIATEDNTLGEGGVVTDILEKYLASFKGECIIKSSGPMGMLRAVCQLAENYNIEAYVSLERYMVCGFGVCNSCVQSVRALDGSSEYKKVCRDGPVFKAGYVLWE